MEAAVISEAITGEQDLGHLQQPEQALAQFYRALKNIDLMGAGLDNPLGGINRGWSEIRPVYECLFSGSNYHFEFYDYILHVFGDIFYAV
jgi:hypothetical protein